MTSASFLCNERGGVGDACVTRDSSAASGMGSSLINRPAQTHLEVRAERTRDLMRCLILGVGFDKDRVQRLVRSD
jgi:hypothetical protein